MKKLMLTVFIASIALPTWAKTSYRLDGIGIAQRSSQFKWLAKQPAGQYKHGNTTVEIRNGEVVTIWGEQLVTPTDAEIKLGQSGESALKILGKPSGGTLYGCGRTSQQIHFYKSEHLDLTVTDQKVTQIRLYKAP